MSDVAKVLNDAADLIDANGWTQGVNRDAFGCYCAVGALEAASPRVDGRWFSRLYYDAAVAVSKETQSSSVVQWNDAEGRTQAEVTTMLRTVAAKQVTR
jgi:hypothetical protein